MHPKRLSPTLLVIAVALSLAAAPAQAGLCELSDEELVALFSDMNAAYAEAGIGVEIAEFECFTIGNGRPAVRILQNPFRWVASDPRRAAQGDDITFIVDDGQAVHAPSSLGAWPSAEVAAGQTTWFGDRCMDKVDDFQRASTGNDDTLFDEGLFSSFCTLPGGDLPGFPSTTLGVPAGIFAADIIHAGWYPAGCFGPLTLAFSVTFTFTGTDVNNDQYADTAFNEVYYNDAFTWDTTGGDIDVQTVALHESGHSLGVGHFGPPPSAVMNPVYAGRKVTLEPIDHAGMCTVWAQWPR